MSDIRDCDSDDVPECLRRVYAAPQAASVEIDRLRQKQQAEAAARQRAAADANNRGMAALNRGDFQEAIDQFGAALQSDPGDATTLSNLVTAKDDLSRAQSLANLQALEVQTENDITTAREDATAQQIAKAMAERQLAAMERAFRRSTTEERRVIYPAIRPLSPSSPTGRVLLRAQPTIADLDERIRRAETVMQRLIQQNVESEQQRVELVKTSADASLNAEHLSIGLVLDLLTAHVDQLAAITGEERADVLNHLLNWTSEDGAIHNSETAYEKLVHREKQIDTLKQTIRATGKYDDLVNRLTSDDHNSFNENLWDLFSQFKMVEDATGPFKDLIDASYTICQQAWALQNLTLVQSNQERTLEAAKALGTYVDRLRAERAKEQSTD